MFKRRDRRTFWQAIMHMVWPKGGWIRSIGYMKHRLRRLPDTPEKIARGVWAGVFASFTPFFGFHLILAWLLARVLRGNVPASLLGTFFGNPVTYVPIAVGAISTGHFLLGSRPVRHVKHGLGDMFSGAWLDLWHNFQAIFTSAKTDWTQLKLFYDDIFLPFMIGGLITGVIGATLMYMVTLPLVTAYQNSRRKRLRAKLEQLNRPAAKGADAD